MASVEKAIKERFSNSEAGINLAAIAQTYKITKLGKIV
jgi:hypothetical protein